MSDAESSRAPSIDDAVIGAAKHTEVRRRTLPLRPFNATHYKAPAHMFIGVMPTLDRVGISLWSMLMTAMRFAEITSNDPNDPVKRTVLTWPELDGEPLYYQLAKRVLVDEQCLAERYATAKGGRVATDDLPAHQNMRALTPEMKVAFDNLNKTVHSLLTLAADPVVVAATIIVGVARARPSSEDILSIAIGCIAADLVLGGHRYPLITSHQWRAPGFAEAVLLCADDERTTHDLTTVYIDSFDAHLRVVLSKSTTARSCDACGINNANLARLTKNPEARVKTCSRCRLVLYCSDMCRSDDKEQHAKFCSDNTIKTASDV